METGDGGSGDEDGAPEEGEEVSGSERGDEGTTCITCNKVFATRRYLKYHRKHHCPQASSYEGPGEGEDAKRFTCNVCQRPFRVLKCMKVLSGLPLGGGWTL